MTKISSSPKSLLPKFEGHHSYGFHTFSSSYIIKHSRDLEDVGERSHYQPPQLVLSSIVGILKTSESVHTINHHNSGIL
ncbi:uncharacterized protein LOC105766005 isoform X2 [Gossypium raimondii]|uniref:uncharacterized protein LOC105766005 isoform X2 n=1 Tax=Gossypium raimondii TaxID=29730 RepID=UPI00227B86A4|nr:uncharacterized protein LOC105766005 isoform X2 [Gossypium raimondii]